MTNLKKKVIGIVITLGVTSTMLTGCFAGLDNAKALHGGVLSNSKGDYVVFKYSGSRITDCWILKNSYVKSESDSDGLNFVDSDGNGILLQGDSKVIRINNAKDFTGYVEYHTDKDLGSYEDFYKQNGIKK